jgi:hypothetical protein
MVVRRKQELLEKGFGDRLDVNWGKRGKLEETCLGFSQNLLRKLN